MSTEDHTPNSPDCQYCQDHMCHCGCGSPTNTITRSNASLGQVKGRYRLYLPNHHPHTKGVQSRTLKVAVKIHSSEDGLCLCGCGNPTNIIKHTVIALGYIQGEHYPYLPNHHPHRKGARSRTLDLAIKYTPPEDGLCLCGCGETTEIAPRTHIKDSWVQGKHKPFINHYHASVYSILTGYTVNRLSGCWIWQRARNEDGYGILGIDGFTKATHWFYTRFRGPIPEGLEPDHTCFERPCVNPSHLELVTRAENTRRRLYCKVTMEDAREIRELHAQVKRGPTMPGALSREEIAYRYGISPVTVSKIWSGESWNEDIE